MYIYATKPNAINDRPSTKKKKRNKIVEIRKIPKCKNLRLCHWLKHHYFHYHHQHQHHHHHYHHHQHHKYTHSATSSESFLNLHTYARIPCHYIYFDALSVNVTVYLKQHIFYTWRNRRETLYANVYCICGWFSCPKKWKEK